MAWVDKNEWRRTSVGHYQRAGKIQIGSQGDRVNPTTYKALHSRVSLTEAFSPNGVPLPAWGMGPTAPSVGFFWNDPDPFPSARNKAWEELVAKTRVEPAALGVALAEIGESAGMIAARALQCYHAYKDLRKGNFRDFLRTLGIGAKRKHRNKIRNAVDEASGLWLEYSFGWSPFFHDMWTAADAMGSPLPGGHVEGRGSENSGGQISSYDTNERWQGTGYCTQRADVYISNPNLYLLQQLGVANPLSIAWELVPFSFVADWVFDIGGFLGSYTDFLGCDVLRPSTSYTFRGFVVVQGKWGGVPYAGAECGGTYVMLRRRPGLSRPAPSFSFRSNIGSSLKRAANAVSLLGQILTK